jgi:DNA invertase Pin-like site-specific DNA recombinase
MTAERSNLAFSYIRFSTPDQAKGDSLRRQLEAAEEYCRKHSLTLDSSLRDLGTSAHKGENAKQGHLAAFLQAIEDGRVPAGSVLIVESVDRISRQGINLGHDLLKKILRSGVRIVTLVPLQEYGPEDLEDFAKTLMLMVVLQRAFEESNTKSKRCGAAWDNWRKSGKAMPFLPAWLKKDGNGGVVVDEDAADTIRRIFQLAIAGYGALAIVNKFTADGVPPIGRSGRWTAQYVKKLLRSRLVLGEFQAHQGRGGKHRKAIGRPTSNFYPALITEAEWLAARAAIHSRTRKAGRPSKKQVNLFTGLLFDGRDGRAIHRIGKGRKAGPLLISYGAIDKVKGSKWVSFPAKVFESSVLTCLREINPRDVMPPSQGGRDVTLTLEAQKLALEEDVEGINHRMKTGRVTPQLLDLLDTKQEQLRAVEDQLATLKRDQAAPLETAWDDCKGLIAAWDEAPAPEEARIRLRSSLRRIVKEIWCLFVARGRERIALVQTFFAGAEWRRDFAISWTPATGPDGDTSLVVASTAGPSNRGLYLKDRTEALAAVESLEADGLKIVAAQYPEALQIVLEHGGSFIDADNGLQVWSVKGAPNGAADATQQADQ